MASAVFQVPVKTPEDVLDISRSYMPALDKHQKSYRFNANLINKLRVAQDIKFTSSESVTRPKSSSERIVQAQKTLLLSVRPHTVLIGQSRHFTRGGCFRTERSLPYFKLYSGTDSGILRNRRPQPKGPDYSIHVNGSRNAARTSIIKEA